MTPKTPEFYVSYTAAGRWNVFQVERGAVFEYGFKDRVVAQSVCREIQAAAHTGRDVAEAEIKDAHRARMVAEAACRAPLRQPWRGRSLWLKFRSNRARAWKLVI